MHMALKVSALLDHYDIGPWETPSLAVDIVIMSTGGGHLRALVMQRSREPEAGSWALPGGFVRQGEDLDAAARRILYDKAGLERVYLEQLYTFGAPGRDPRTRVVTVAYFALVPLAALAHLDAPDAAGSRLVAALTVPWDGEAGGPVGITMGSGAPGALAFDHADILGMAVKRLRGKLGYTDIGFALLPERFTLRELRLVHETILARPINKDSFRRRILAAGLVEDTGERQSEVGHRPARLYRRKTPTAE